MRNISGYNRGKYHGIKSKLLSKYALQPLSIPQLYNKGLGHTVSIYLDPSFASENVKEIETKT